MQNPLVAILDNIEVLVYVTDINTYEVLYVNEYTRRLFGDIKGKICWQSIQKGQDGPCSFCTNDKIVNADGTPTGVYHWEFQNTVSGKWFDIRDTAIDWEDGRIVRLEVATDITERKKAEEELHQSKQQYQSLIENIPSVTWITDINGKTTFISSNIKEIYGYAPEEIYETGESLWIGRIHAEDLEAVKEAYNNLFKKRGSFDIEYRIKRKDGEWIWLHDRAVTIHEKEGVQIAYGVFSDITERKRAEAQLIHSYDLMNYIISHARSCIAVHDRDLNYIYVSDRYLKEYKVKEKNILGKHHYEIFPDLPQKWRDVHQRVLKGEVLSAEEDPYYREDGLLDWTRWECRPWYESDGSIGGLIVYTEIITERKKAEQEQDRLNAELAQKNKELEQIVYITSHDLRTPLVNIGGYSKEITKSLEEVVSILQNAEDLTVAKEKVSLIAESNIAESENYISKNIYKMEKLLSGLLNLSRLGQQELNKEKLNMNDLMSDIAKSMTYQVNDIGAKLELSDLPICAGDAIQINQLFSNLIGNALKYLDSKHSGVIKVSGRNEQYHSVYCVEDNGIGISPKHHEKIFEIFYQLNPSKVEGEGLGLSIASKIVNSHGGKIWIESELGKGSKFFVSLPKA